MRQVLIMFVCTLYASSIWGQTDHGRFVLSIEGRDSWPVYRATGDTPKSAVKNFYHEPEYRMGFNVAFRFKKNLFAEIGYTKEQHRTKGKVLKSTEGGGSLLTARQVSCRVKYKQPLVTLFKHNLYLMPTLGYTLGINQGYGSLSLGDGVTAIDLGDVVLIQTFRRGIEYNLRRTFHLLELRGQLGYELSNDIDVYFSGGYNYGFNTLGKLNMAYVSTTEGNGAVTTETRGTSFFLLVGLAYNFGKRQ